MTFCLRGKKVSWCDIHSYDISSNVMKSEKHVRAMFGNETIVKEYTVELY